MNLFKLEIKLIMLEVLLNPEWEKEHEFEMLLKCRWFALFFSPNENVNALQIKSRLVWWNHSTAAWYNLLSRKYQPRFDSLFHPKALVHPRHGLLYVFGSRDRCAQSSVSEFYNEEKSTQCGISNSTRSWNAFCEWYLLHIQWFC